jgi:cell division cycle protein 20 (cofactor of APC complex)
MLHAYPSMERIAEIRDAHDSRVLFSALSPAGDVVVTGAGDENLKFWRVWEVEKSKVGKKKAPGEPKETRVNSTTREGILSIR